MVKPILFNAEMVRAILDGRKTVTRRVVKPQPEMHMFGDHEALAWLPPALIKGYLAVGVKYTEYLKKPCRPGDVLWVRETWCEYIADHVIDGVKYAYRADTSAESERFRKELGYKWRPSIHMPREAARIFLRVTDVRVERLRHITRDGAIAEGCNAAIPVLEFQGLWDSTIKPADRDRYGWAANPFCWVISFDKISKDEAMQ